MDMRLLKDSLGIKELFAITQNDILCNTSYPFSPKFFEQYKSSQDIMANTDKIAVYIHIPFCANLCKFCEYTRFSNEDKTKERAYISLLKNQIQQYTATHNIKSLYGIDVGGGTPTSLSSENFETLMGIADELIKKYPKATDFEGSIEFSASTINDDKIRAISRAGFKRASTGIQVFNQKMLKENNRRFASLNRLLKISEALKNYGITKLNIDLMYGLPQQTVEMLKDTMDAINVLKPEQVTLYETRYNMNGIRGHGINRKTLFDQYNLLFTRLLDMGYKARFGQNTFSKENDEGVSSYLKHRMYDGIAYKGFGISAQSMSRTGISYNSLKSCKEIHMPHIDEIREQDNYLLPPEEIAAKYVSIALYSARFSLGVLSDIVGTSALNYYKDEFDFLQEGEYISVIDNDCYLTQKGFMYYGAVASMFWSRTHKARYLLLREKEASLNAQNQSRQIPPSPRARLHHGTSGN